MQVSYLDMKSLETAKKKKKNLQWNYYKSAKYLILTVAGKMQGAN